MTPARLISISSRPLNGAHEATVTVKGRTVRITATRGVVLACGGFPQDPALRAKHFPHVQRGGKHVSPAPTINTGDGVRMALGAGAAFIDRLSNPAAWIPVSKMRRGVRQRKPFLSRRGRGDDPHLRRGTGNRGVADLRPPHRAQIRLAAGGHRLAIVDIDHDRALERADELESLPSGGHMAVTADMAREDEVTAMVAAVAERCGRIDGLINNAGIGDSLLPTLEQTIGTFERILHIHLTGIFLASPHAAISDYERRWNTGP